MNNELLLNAISNIDCEFIAEASEFSIASVKEERAQRQPRRRAYFGLAAACAAVAVAIIVPLSVGGIIGKTDGNLSGSPPGESKPAIIYGLGSTQTAANGSIRYTERGDYSFTVELEITDNRYDSDIYVNIEGWETKYAYTDNGDIDYQYMESYIITTDPYLYGYGSTIYGMTIMNNSLLSVTVNGEPSPDHYIPNTIGKYTIFVDYSAYKEINDRIWFHRFHVWNWQFEIYM